MPKVIFRGPTHRLQVDDLVLERDGDAVELTDDQYTRAQNAAPDLMFEVEGPNAPKSEARTGTSTLKSEGAANASN